MTTPLITHCIFDMDGLLLDTERVYTEVTQEILDKYANGARFTWDIKSKLMGRTGDESARIVVETYKLPMTVQEYLDITAKIQHEKFPLVRPLDGVERLIRHLHQHKIPIAVATSSTRSKFELKTSQNQDLFSLFDFIVCGDDDGIKYGKPSPDLFLLAQQRLGNPPSDQCLVFEDAVNGVQAALNAKMHVIWIPDENILNLSENGETHGATQVLKTMADFDPLTFKLPAFGPQGPETISHDNLA
ncbi:HAD-like domain-containing protein [Halteromyces radiatus]|uniref:HAD-like domain-containing protein n=1 Tax=Halteromyces radiatus TaxID=101107 RepID=UPI00221F86D6|nr:HAD-like domain-containing protein [Halteromyces radiatus]KAI8081715.1 HAD-like domain-containing protein [Halteromyces radiatus]